MSEPELKDVECLILNGKRSKLICSNCIIEGCSMSIEAKQEDVGKAHELRRVGRRVAGSVRSSVLSGPSWPGSDLLALSSHNLFVDYIVR